MDTEKNDLTVCINKRTGKVEMLSRSGLLNLANAIIIRACDDYKMLPYKNERMFIEKFIRSGYFEMLSRGCVPAEKLINHLVHEAEKEDHSWRDQYG